MVLLRLVFLDKEYSSEVFSWQSPILIAGKKQEAVIQRCSVKRVFLKISQTTGFSCKFCEIFKSIFFQKTPLVAASVKACNCTKIRLSHGSFCELSKTFWNIILMCCVKKMFAKNPAADVCFVKTILLTAVIMIMLSVSWY